MKKEEEKRVIEQKREKMDKRNTKVERTAERKSAHHIIFQNKK